MAMSMLHQEGKSGWQTVKSKADDKKKKIDEKKSKKEEPKKDRAANAADPAKKAFAAFDLPDFVMGGDKSRSKQQSTGATPYVGTFTGLAVEALPSFDDEPTNPGTPPNAEDIKNTHYADGSDVEKPVTKAKRPAAPKVKKPKITISTVAEELNLEQLELLLASLADKYRTNDNSQVEMLADHFLKVFKDVELPFNNILLEKPLGKAADVIISELPVTLVDLLSNFLKQKSIEALGAVTCSLVVAILEGLPEGAKAKPGYQPPKAKVGLLVVLSVLLRACPAALVQASPGLLAAGRQLTAPGRLPHFIWVMSQAASVNPSAAVAVIMRVLVPQMLGSDMLAALAPAPAPGKKVAAPAVAEARPAGPTMDSASQPAVLEYLSLLLCGSPEGSTLLPERLRQPDVLSPDGQVLSAAVPPLVLEAIVRSVQLEAAGGTLAKSTRSRLAALYPALYQLAGTSSAPRQFTEWLPLALETAGMSSASYDGVGDDLVVHAASSVLACLSRDDASFGVWESKHKSMVKGSARVLQHLYHARPPALRRLLKSAEKLQHFNATLVTLQKRHVFHLSPQGKGAQRTAARAAQEACQRLLSGAAASRGAAASSGSAPGAAVGILLLTALAVGGVLAAAYNRTQVVGLIQQYAGEEATQKVEAALAAIHSTTQPYAQQALDASRPVVAAAQGHLQQALTAAQPYLTELQDKLEQAKTQARLLLKQAMSQ